MNQNAQSLTIGISAKIPATKAIANETIRPKKNIFGPDIYEMFERMMRDQLN